MTKQEILNMIQEQEQAAWTQLNSLIHDAAERDPASPFSIRIHKAKEKWSTLYCLLEKLDQ